MFQKVKFKEQLQKNSNQHCKNGREGTLLVRER